MSRINLIKIIIFYIYFYFALTLSFFLIWIFSKFGRIEFDVFLINLDLIKVEIFSNSSNYIEELKIVESFKKRVVYQPLGIVVIIGLLNFFINKLTINFKNKIINFFYKIKKKLHIIVIFCLTFFIIFGFFYILNIGSYYFSKSYFQYSNTDYFAKINNDYNLKKNKKKNLILITLESYDLNFLESLSNRNALKPSLVDEISSVKYKHYKQKKIFNLKGAPGTQVSLLSQIAMLCGVYLKLPTNIKKSNNNHLIDNKLLNPNYLGGFLDKIECLQDHLRNEKYNTALIMNTDYEFHSSNQFYDYHKFDNIFDNKYLKKNGLKANPYGFWGAVSDGDTLKFAFDYIKKIKEKNFFFINIILTDTHAPGSFYDRSCFGNSNNQISLDIDILKKKSRYFSLYYKKISSTDLTNMIKFFVNNNENNQDNNFINAFKCTNMHLVKFLRNIDELKLNNTNIFLVGDHKMQIKENYENFENEIFNMLVFEKKENYESRSGINNHFDLFPYLLMLTGLDVSNQKANLGDLSQNYNKINYEKRLSDLKKAVSNNSKKYKSLW